MPIEASPTIERSAMSSSPTRSLSHDGQRSSPLPRSLDDLPLILTIKEAADLLAVDRRTIYSEIQSRRLRAFKVGNAYRIERDSLLTFIRADRPHSKRR